MSAPRMSIGAALRFAAMVPLRAPVAGERGVG